MTQELEKRFAQVGSQDGAKDPIVVTEFFDPCGIARWYATEYDPKEKMFFGYASIFCDENDEWGYFSLEELESIKCPLGLGIERNLYWTEQRASQVINRDR